MEIHTLAVDYLSNFRILDAWPEIISNFKQLGEKKPRGWELSLDSCISVGGTYQKAIPAVAAIGCWMINIILIDDMLDDDPRGMFHRIGAPATANLASAFQAAGILAITESDVDDSVKLAAINVYNQTLLMTTIGQNMDVKNPDNEADYWEMVKAKSSPYSAGALYLGAIFGGATVELSEKIKRLGDLYGEMIQIHDDMKDALATPPNPDWLQGRFALPVLFATIVDHPDRDRFIELRKTITDPQALKEAQEILIRSGAISFSVDQLIKRYQIARSNLAGLELVDHSRLGNMLEAVIRPVRELLVSIDVELPEALQESAAELKPE